MRILLISHTCQSATEGQPKAECLARIPGVDLRVMVPDRWKHYGKWRSAEVPAAPDYHYEVGKVAMPWMGPAQFYLHWYPQLRADLESFRPDIIDLWEEPWGLGSAHTCWLRNRILPSARIITETEQNILKRLPPPFERFRSYTLKHADAAVARSVEALAVLRAKGFEGPARVVPNGVDVELFRPLDREQCRRELGLRQFTVGYVGRLVDEKGLMDLMDAVAVAPPTVDLLYVGDGPLQHTLQTRAAELGLNQRVKVLPAKPQRELPRIMNAVDVLALPSRTTGRWKEQFGRVLIEAHACETPVIASDSGAIPEVVGEGGIVCCERNPASLAAAIREFQNHPQRRRQLGVEGRRQVLEKYTWQRVAEQMYRYYRETLEVPPIASASITPQIDAA